MNIVDSWKRQHTSFGKMAVVLFYSYVWLFMVASVIQMINPIGQGWEYLVPTTTSEGEEGKDNLKVYFAWLIQLIYAYLFALTILAESVGPRVSSLVVLTLGTGIVALFNIRTKQILGSMDQDTEACWTAVVQLDMTAIVWSILALVLLLVDVQIGSGTNVEETQSLV
jgi:hypothetical protein